MKNNKNNRGFASIRLVMMFSVIGLLSSFMFSSLGVNKAQAFLRIPDPAAPTSFTATIVGSYVKFDYTDTILNNLATQTYEIEKSTSPNGPFTLDHTDTYTGLSGPITKTSYSNCMSPASGYTRNTTYYFRIRSVIGGYSSGYTASATTITTPRLLFCAIPLTPILRKN